MIKKHEMVGGVGRDAWCVVCGEWCGPWCLMDGCREKPYSRRICTIDVRIFVIPKRQHPPTIKAKRSEGYEETRSAKFEETRSGNIDFRIQGLPTQQSR